MSARRASVIDALRVATIPLQARPPTCDRESANDGRIGRATSADPKLDHGHPHQSPSNLRRILGPAAYRPVRRSIEPPPIDPGLRAYRRPGMCRDLLTFGDLCRGRQHCEVAHSLVVDGVHTAVTRHGFAGSGLPCKRCPASTPPCAAEPSTLWVGGAGCVSRAPRPACLKKGCPARHVLREVAVHDEYVGGVPRREPAGLVSEAARRGGQRGGGRQRLGNRVAALDLFADRAPGVAVRFGGPIPESTPAITATPCSRSRAKTRPATRELLEAGHPSRPCS